MIGGGPTGVEMAGTFAELAQHTLRGEFRRFDPSSARVVLLEGADRVLGALVPKLSQRAREQLERLGVDVRTGSTVTHIDAEGVTYETRDGDAATTRIACPRARSCGPPAWPASPLGRALERSAGAKLDRAGRVIVEPDLSLAGHPEISVVGDLAAAHEPRQGRAEAGARRQPGRQADGARRRGEPAAPPARRADARVSLPQLRRPRDDRPQRRGGRRARRRSSATCASRGFIAWLFWLFVHIYFLIGFRNRLHRAVRLGRGVFHLRAARAGGGDAGDAGPGKLSAALRAPAAFTGAAKAIERPARVAQHSPNRPPLRQAPRNAHMERTVFAQAPSIPLISRLGAAMHELRPRTTEAIDSDTPDFLFGGGDVTMLQMILDHVHFGVTVVGPQFRLLFANKAALRECERHPVLRIDRGRLFVAESRHECEFARALAAARSGRWSVMQVAHGGERTMLAMLPLRPNAVCADAPALVVFGLRAGCKRLMIQFYAQTHGLSPTETSVLRALGEGLSPREIAQRHAVALSTVRSQVGSIRAKTGAHSVTELLLTLGALPPIMPAALSAV